jgi:hypothetical protein
VLLQASTYGVRELARLNYILVNKSCLISSMQRFIRWYNWHMNERGSQHKISQKISLVTADEEQIWEKEIALNRRVTKEKIVPEDWSILDIFLPPSREPVDQST